MRALALLIGFGLFAGCSTSSWKDTGKPGPWCAPNTQARVLYRTVDAPWLPNPQSEMAFVGKSGGKKSDISFWNELDDYFLHCPFIEQWPAHGRVGTRDGHSIPEHELPFDLCLVSMNPTVIIGSERQDPKVSSFWPLDKSSCAFIGSTFLLDKIAVRTTVPYHAGAKVIWFSPSADQVLHELALTSGTASFVVCTNVEISVVVDGTELKSLRK